MTAHLLHGSISFVACASMASICDTFEKSESAGKRTLQVIRVQVSRSVCLCSLSSYGRLFLCLYEIVCVYPCEPFLQVATTQNEPVIESQLPGLTISGSTT